MNLINVKPSYHKLSESKLRRFLVLQSSLATLMQLRSEEENEIKIATYTVSIALIQKELSAVTSRSSVGGA